VAQQVSARLDVVQLGTPGHARHNMCCQGRTGQKSRRDYQCGQGSHKGLEARSNHRGGLAGRRGSRTCRGELGPTVETVESYFKRKSRSVRLGEVASGKLSSSKTTCRQTIRRFVERSRQR
jgi:hypothetical protein